MSLLSQFGVKSLVSRYQSFQDGLRLIDGGELRELAGSIQNAFAGLVATVGGTALTSTALHRALNTVSTSTGTNTDSLVFPPAIPGSVVYVENNTGNTIKLWAATTNPANSTTADLITAHNALSGAAAASITQATTIFAQYTCTTIGFWKQGLMT